jgi:hypothetical protein
VNATFRPYRAPSWSGLMRYFVEWRKRALMRRELRILRDHRQWEDIIPPTLAHDVEAACSPCVQLRDRDRECECER